MLNIRRLDHISFLALGLVIIFAPASGTIAFSCGNACEAPKSNECTIVVQEYLRFDNVIDVSFECILDPRDAGGDENMAVPIRLSDEQKLVLQTKFENGELQSQSSTLMLGQDMLISNEGVFIPVARNSFGIGKRQSNNGLHIGEGGSNNGRNLSITEGDKPFLVVKVTDSQGRKRNESTDQISDNIFGTDGDNMTLKSQMNDCSFGKFKITAGVGNEHEASPGVIEVTIDKSLVGNSPSTIEQAVTTEVQSLLGHSLPGPYAHVMYVLEGCYTDCGWAAYAHVDSWLSAYQGQYYKMVGVQMHEIGHNINLGHSGGLDGSTYTDHTGMMGNPLYSDDIGAMCFNAAKSWQLGWYDSSKISIDPREGSWTGNIVGVADFANNPQNDPVIVKVETRTETDQFIAFNRATGINRHNVEADDEVTIVQAGLNGELYSQSFLKATLRSGEVYTIPNWDGTQDLTITAKAININTGSSADYAEVSVCLGPCVDPTTEAPSKQPSHNPTKAPTSAPSKAPTPSSSNSGTVHYSQMGIDIDGQINDDALGKSVAISKDGFRVAIAASGEQGGRGVTRAFVWDGNVQEWVQVGQDIVGASANDGLGWSMAMNEDGSRIALGAPEANSDDGNMRVYELDDSNTWQLLGDEINPAIGSKGQVGVSVTMNASGDRVAFGAPRTNSYGGRVKVFQLVGGQWIPMGQNIDSNEYYSYSGGSISMAADGKRIVIGSRLGDDYRGIVKVYDYDDIASQWQLNGSMNGLDYYDRFGGDVDISEDGTRIVVGAPTSDGQESGVYNAGEFQVFDYDGSNWNRLGQKIIGATQMDKLGETVVISGDGTHIAISSPESDDNGTNAGKVKVYKFSEEDQAWLPQGIEILGECAGYKLGEGGGSIALDRSGAHLAIGAERGNYYAGMSRVFETLAGEGDANNGSVNEC